MQENVEPQLQEVDGSQVLGEQPTMEVTLQEFDHMVEKYKAFKRLIANPDFLTIIADDYLGDDLQRNQDLLTVMDNRKIVEAREKIIERIYAKGHLKQFLKEIETSLAGIDNPEQRVTLVKELEAMEAGEQ